MGLPQRGCAGTLRRSVAPQAGRGCGCGSVGYEIAGPRRTSTRHDSGFPADAGIAPRIIRQAPVHPCRRAPRGIRGALRVGRPMTDKRLRRRPWRFAALAAIALGLAGCARVGRLTTVQQPVSPVATKVARVGAPAPREVITLRPLFGDTAIGLVPATGDTSRRYLGRLRTGYTADTLNLFVFGDNRPGWYASRLAPEWDRIHKIFTPHPVAIAVGLFNIPWAIVKGLLPDGALLRDLPNKLRNM